MKEKAFTVFCSCINYLNKEALDKAIAKGLWEEKAHLSAVLDHHCSDSRNVFPELHIVSVISLLGLEADSHQPSGWCRNL